MEFPQKGRFMNHSILSEAKAMEDELIAHRRYLHQIPETGFTLPQTTEYVRKKLTEYGLEPKVVGKAGITALIGPDTGKTFLIRGDMDALPMTEESGLPFSSSNGSMHACGHDFHTSALLGAAKLLKAHEHELHGRVKLMFQPAEEIMDGARDMVDSGILKNPCVDAAMALHVLHDKLGIAGYARGKPADRATYLPLRFTEKAVMALLRIGILTRSMWPAISSLPYRRLTAGRSTPMS